MKIDPLRFRANLYIDGARPWEEFDWIGSDIRIGDGLFRADRRNGRCGATNVDPQTGRRDLDLPGSLRATFGHKELGIYLIARESCQLTIGAHVATPDSVITTARIPLPLVREPLAEQQKFICGGCYFIYEPASGLPDQAITSGTPFAKISSDWRCPDCGTEKITFRPYVEPDHPHGSGKRHII